MKNNNKIISIIFIIIFFVVFSFFNLNEYKNFHKNKINSKENETILQEKLQNFQLSDIKKLENINFYYTPNKELLTKIV